MLLLLTASRDAWSPDDLLRFILLQINTGNPITGWGNNILPFGAIWTIAVEFQFYLLFPILLTILRNKNGISSLLWMIIAFATLRFFLGIHKGPDIYYNSYHTMLSRIDQFLIGMIAAELWRRKTTTRFTAVGLIAIGFIILSIDVTNHRVNLYRLTLGMTVEAIAWSTIIIGYASIFNGQGRTTKLIAKLGNLTFSIYLLHFFLATKIYEYFINSGYGLNNSIINFIFYAYIPTLLISIITYKGIEKPFLNLKMSYLK